MARKPLISPTTEEKIETFAEDLGRLLGHAQNKAQGWMQQRHQIVSQLEEIRDTASSLLDQLGSVSGKAAKRASGAYRSTARTQPEDVAEKVKTTVRKMSDEARARIAAAQKRRWAKWRKENAE